MEEGVFCLVKSMIYLSPPHMSGNEQKFIQEAFDTNWIAPLGPHVDAFEKEIAAYVGAKGAAAVSSGTAAIHLALLLLGVGKGDKVFCPTFTFVGSANPILYVGAEPIFIDSEPDTWNMSPNALKRAMIDAAVSGKLPKAVIVVHIYGQSAKLDEILAICKEYDVPLLEDAAESFGTLYKGKATGTFGDYGTFSFNGNKILSVSGGGVIVSNHENGIEKAKFLASQAKDSAPYYVHSELGYNYRMSNILAGIGRAQLQVIDERIQARRKIFQEYQKQLGHLPGIQFLTESENTRSNYWLTVMRMKKEYGSVSELLAALREEKIEGRHVWNPLHKQPLYKGALFYPHEEGESISEQLFAEGICLPSGSNMTKAEQLRVIHCIKDVFAKKFQESL
jgi:pyridoxal phosphate-dependent aminotransferase EpsN